MTKKYTVVRTKVPQAGGGFIEAFELGLVEMSCLGETYYDLAGYPYDDEGHAFMDDWSRLGGDFRVAAGKIDQHVRNKIAHGVAGADDGKGKKVEARATTEAATPSKK